jgi:hypothetical protein
MSNPDPNPVRPTLDYATPSEKLPWYKRISWKEVPGPLFLAFAVFNSVWIPATLSPPGESIFVKMHLASLMLCLLAATFSRHMAVRLLALVLGLASGFMANRANDDGIVYYQRRGRERVLLEQHSQSPAPTAGVTRNPSSQRSGR